MLDGALQRLAARRQPVQVGDGDAGAGDAGRVDLLAEVGDGGVDAGQHGRGETGRIAEGLRQDLKQLGRARTEAVDGVMQRRPQLGPAAEEADHDQRVEGLDDDDVVGVERVVKFIDGGDQQPVGGVDVAVAVQQVIRTRDGGLDRAAGAGVSAAGLPEQARSVAQVAGHDGAHVGGLCQPSAPAFGRGAELGRAQELGDGAHGVAPPQAGVGEFLKERGNPRVGFLGRLCEMPGVPFGLVGESGGELGMGVAALGACRQLHDRRPDKGWRNLSRPADSSTCTRPARSAELRPSPARSAAMPGPGADRRCRPRRQGAAVRGPRRAGPGRGRRRPPGADG